jgi:AcrR family transcriptional regulator
MSPRHSRKDDVLEAGLALASQLGLSGLTIGGLADAADLTKAGLYAHFDSKDDLLLAVLRHAVERFTEDGVKPALKRPAGEARLRALFEAWLEWTDASPLPGGCVFISTAVEFDDRPGRLRDYLVSTQSRWRALLTETVERAREAGQFRADLDATQVVFELHSLILAFHYYRRLFRDPAARERTVRSFDGLLERSRAPVGGVQ